MINILKFILFIENSILPNCKEFKEITILPCKEKNIDLYEDKFIIFKSKKGNNYDTLLWAKPTLKIVTIPSFINTIFSSSFENCSLKQIKIPSSLLTQYTTREYYGISSDTKVIQVATSKKCKTPSKK